MLEQPLAAYLLWGLEPELDCADPASARRALGAAEAVIAFSSFRSPYLDCAHVVLPIAAFAETAGTFVNCEGRAQTFNGAVPAPGEARPGWKVLRVLGNELGLDGFDYESPEDVRVQALPAAPRYALSAIATTPATLALPGGAPAAAERIADVPLYFTDPLVRNAESLQKTAAARSPAARANAATLAHFGVVAGATVRVRQGQAAVLLPCVLDTGLPDMVVRVAAGHSTSVGLGPMFGAVTLESA
jgi:NADH-quinone oxidoreductase subunit G